MEKVKFIQVNEDALPVRHDGYGYRFIFAGVFTARRNDGIEVVSLFTGWNIVLPEGYVGTIYHTPAMNLLSGYVQQSNMVMTNKTLEFFFNQEGRVREDLDLRQTGFRIVLIPNAGISSILFSPKDEFIGMAVTKIDTLSGMEVEKNIPEIKKEEKEPKTIK